MDSNTRTLVKAVGYKLVSIALLAIISWIFTKDLIKMSFITVIYQVISMLGYFIYERIWCKVKWEVK